MSEPNNVNVPQWLVLGMFGAVITMTAAGGNAIFNLRDTVMANTARMVVVESKMHDSDSVERRLTKVEAKLDLVLERLLPPPATTNNQR